MENLPTLAAILLAMEMAAFGWRINREISVGDDPEGPRKTWLPVADCLNVMMIFLVVGFCVVWPLISPPVRPWQTTVLVVGFIFAALYPVNTAAHYRLLPWLGGRGRGIYLNKGYDFPYITDQEVVYLGLTLSLASSIAMSSQHISITAPILDFLLLWILCSSVVAIWKMLTPPRRLEENEAPSSCA